MERSIAVARFALNHVVIVMRAYRALASAATSDKVEEVFTKERERKDILKAEGQALAVIILRGFPMDEIRRVGNNSSITEYLNSERENRRFIAGYYLSFHRYSNSDCRILA